MKSFYWLMGYGSSSSIRPVKRGASTMWVALSADGLATVGTAHHEIGNRIYTVSRWNAAETWGLHRGYYLRDTGATGPGLWGGSSATTSLVPVLAKGCDTLREELA